MRYRNLTIIGSSHISIESVNAVKTTIETQKPGIVAIELDSDRLHALMHPQKRKMFVRGVGFKGMVFGLVAYWIEKSLGRMVNVDPGTEMKTAIQLAQKQKAKIALIDQNISITLKRISQQMTWKEKWRIFADMILGIVTPKRQMKKLNLGYNDLSKVPDKKTIKKLLTYTQKRYPNIYNVLVHERNIYMANNLAAIMRTYPNEGIVAVVGAGHEDELLSLIKEKLYKDKKAQ